MIRAVKKIQVIQSLDGKPEYVLLPYELYQQLQGELERKINERRDTENADYVPFVLEDFVDNPAALARIRARISQAELARRMGVSQAYVSKFERQERVTPRLMERVRSALQS